MEEIREGKGFAREADSPGQWIWEGVGFGREEGSGRRVDSAVRGAGRVCSKSDSGGRAHSGREGRFGREGDSGGSVIREGR